MAQEANVFVGAAAEPWSTMTRITLPLVLPANTGAANEEMALRPSRLEVHP